MISFPGFGLNFNINSVAINLFGINIYWYSICIVFGMIVAIILCKKSKENYNIKFEFMLDCLIVGIIFGIIGARLYYVLFNMKYYAENPGKIFAIRDGGLAIFGGLIFGTISIFAKCKINKINPINVFDYICPFIAIAQSIGRWGNFFNQEAYGTHTNVLWRMGIYANNNYIEVHPTFLYESICNFIIFFILRKVQKNQKFEGEIFLSYLFLYSGIRMIIEGFRSDSLMFLNFKISQVLAIIIFVFSGIILLKKNKKHRNTEKKEYKL